MHDKDIIEAVLLRDIVNRLRENGINEEQIKSLSLPSWQPNSLSHLDLWSKRYLVGGHLWGDEASTCGKFLIGNLPPNSKVLDLGCGYGRDSKKLVEHGHNVLALDMSKIAVIDASEQLEEAIEAGQASVMRANFMTAPIIQRAFDAVLSHRVIHLEAPENVESLVTRMAKTLKSGGHIAISARSPEDFNPEQMVMTAPMTAEYKERPGHKIHFYDEERLRSVLSPKFTEFSFTRGEEIESVGNNKSDGSPVMTQYVRVTARKATGAEIKEFKRNETNDNLGKPEVS